MAAPAAAPPVAINIDAVGQAFVKHYYTLFDTQRANLAPLYVGFCIETSEWCAL